MFRHKAFDVIRPLLKINLEIRKVHYYKAFYWRRAELIMTYYVQWVYVPGVLRFDFCLWNMHLNHSYHISRSS